MFFPPLFHIDEVQMWSGKKDIASEHFDNLYCNSRCGQKECDTYKFVVLGFTSLFMFKKGDPYVCIPIKLIQLSASK